MITHETFGRWSFTLCASSRQYNYWVFIRSVIGRGITCICVGCLFAWSLSNGYKSFTRILWRNVRADRRLAWTHYGSQIFLMTWHTVDRYVLCTGNSCHTSHFIFCGTSSMWSLYPHSATRFEDSRLLIVCRRRCSIDSFQPYAVPIDPIGWCCSRGHVILWRDVVPVYRFRYSPPFFGGYPFYSSVTSLDDAVTRGDVCTVESKSNSPFI